MPSPKMKFKDRLIIFAGYSVGWGIVIGVILLFRFAILIGAPPKDAHKENGTWALPIGEQIDFQGEKCQTYQIYDGFIVNGKPWMDRDYYHIIGTFIKCGDEKLEVKPLPKHSVESL